MEKIKERVKFVKTSNTKKDNVIDNSKFSKKDILKAVQVQDTMRKKYKADKDWNSVDIIRKIRDNR